MFNQMGNNTDEKHINDLVNSCLSFVYKKGKVISEKITGLNPRLEMKYKVDDLAFYYKLYSPRRGNGSSFLQVRKGEEVVLEAKGCFTAGAYGMKAKVYQCGDWEKLIPEWNQ